MQATNVEDIYSLSPMQQGILFEELATPGSSNYVVQLLFQLAGKLDPQALRRAWELTIEHHPILRTSFHLSDSGKALQVVRRHAQLPVTHLNWSNLKEVEQEAQLQVFLEDERCRAFDVTVAPLMRLTLIELGGDRHRLVWSHHHLLLDGWSLPRMLSEIFSSYESLVKGKHPRWQPARPFRDYITWLQQQDVSQAEPFWRGYLSGFTMPTPLPLCSAHHWTTAGKERGHADQKISLTPGATAALGKVARTYQLTLNSVVQGAWAVLLSRYSGCSDVVFGATVSGRPAELEGVERMLGLFINTLPVRVKVSSHTKIYEWLRALQENNAEARQYEYSPLSEVQRWSEVERGQALFDSVLAFMNYPISTALREQAREDTVLKVERVQSFERTNFGLSVVVAPSDQLLIQISYDTNSFEHATVERVTTHLKTLLESIAANPEQRVCDLSLLTGDERRQLLFGWNDTARPLRKEICLHELFEQQVNQTPDNLALVFEDVQLSYGELNRRANQLAHYLRALGIRPDDRVAICVERSIEMAVAVLGTLKAGGAYVPIDPAYPQERLSLMLEDSEASVILTQQHIVDRLLTSGLQVVQLDTEWHVVEQQKNNDLSDVTNSDSAAYCIYTSGSTGRPKGAVVTHRALVNYTLAMRDQLDLSPVDRILQFASFSFSVFVEEVFPAWASGAAVVFAPQDRLASCEPFTDLLRQQRVTGCELPVPFWHEWVHELATNSVDVPPSLRFVMVGCEKPSSERLAQWSRFSLPLIQVFGLTETSITSTLYKVPKDTGHDTFADLPIGKPIANTQVYALDEYLQPVPVGVAGELYIGGEGLGRGYQSLAEVTAEKFIPHPFSAEPGARLYRTGDLAKFLPDGNLCFLGRLDDQIKIRGIRVELGEIESILNQHPEINSTVVTAREHNGHRRLVAYVVRKSSANGNGHDRGPGYLREYLLKHLPEYLVPAQIVMLDQLPLTPNGKVDRKALPAPEQVRAAENGEKTGPRTKAEELLCEVWQEVLGLERVGVEENFFELGGDSILSIQVVSRAARRGLRLTPRQLFQHQTVASLAEVAQVAEEAGSKPAGDAREEAREAPLLPIQRWFFKEVTERRNHWNQPLLLEVTGEVNPELLETALKLVRRQHPALELSFNEGPEGWRQCLSTGEKNQPFLTVVDLSSIAGPNRKQELERLANQAQQSLDLERGQLLRVVLFRGDAESARLLIVVHHIVMDGVSWRVLLEDLQSAYEQLQGGRMAEEVQLLKEGTTFTEWTRRLEEFGQSEEMQAEGNYWRDVQASGVRLPLDFEGGRNREQDAAHVVVELTPSETEALLREVPPVYRTEINDALLTALGRALWRWTGERHPVVEMEGHGREEFASDLDVSRTVGWFATVFPVELEAGDRIEEDLKGVKERLRRVPRRGLGYGLWRYGEERDEGAEGQLLFNYLGQLDGAVRGESMFRPAPESAGASVWGGGARSHVLAINSSVANGQLAVVLSYSRELHRRETIAQLGQWLVEELQALIAHCHHQGAGGFTPSDFPLIKLGQRQLDELMKGREREIEDIYPLSPMQQGMLFHNLYSPEAGEYVAQFVLPLREKLDEPALQRAWQQTIDNHPVLRASLAWENIEQPLHVIHKRVALRWNEHDWRGENEAEQQARLEEFLRDDRQRGFDFARAPLMRLALIRTGENTWQFVWSLAMLLVDGWSLPLLLAEVFSAYKAYANGQEYRPLPAPPFREYVAWLGKQDLAKAERFWRDYLNDFNSPTPLPLSHWSKRDTLPAPGEAVDKKGYGEVSFRLSSESTARVQDLARAHQLTINTVVQGAWAVLLSRHSGESDVIFGAAVSGRPAELEDVERMIGLFINTLPVRVNVSKAEPLCDWLRALQDSHVEARQFEFTPLTEAQRWSGVERGQSLFASILVFENYPVDTELRKHESEDGLRIGEVKVREQTNYPLALVSFPGDVLKLKLEYSRERYSHEEGEMLLRQLGVLLEAMVEDPRRKVSELPLLTAEERHRMLVEWNDTRQEYNLDICIHELFEQQAASSPTAVAVVSSSGSLTYGDLNARANQLARYLCSSGVGPESRVALFMNHSAEMVVAILGVLKAGGAYVPLDPDFPPERISYTLDDSAAAIVITQAQLAERLPKTTAHVLKIDAEWERIEREGSEKLASKACAQNLVYVIYTSGSTGKPKGVMISHGALVNYLIWCCEVFEVGGGYGAPIHAPVAFDGTKTSLFFPLLTGQSLVMLDNELGVDGLIESFRCGDEYSLVKITPAHLNLLSQELSGEELRGRTRTLIVGGEALCGENVTHWIKHAPETRLIQEYGPTETTVSSCWYEIPRTESLSGAIPIGRPISNTEFFILDHNLAPVPVGAIGEIYIGGCGLARGYLDRADLTAEKFVPHPFATEPGARLYRTGDVARYLLDGNIEFIGRADNQVKLRGVRIELGEIEAALLQHPSVSEATVIISEEVGQHARLIACVSGEQLSNAVLRAHLSAKLPAQMIPSAFVILDHLPLTPNGKIDRKALLVSIDSHRDAATVYVAHRTAEEEIIVAIWQQVLGVDRVGVTDNFFELGGHSLLATQVIWRLRRALGVMLPLRAVFEAPTVRELAARAVQERSSGGATEAPPLVAQPRDGLLPLSFAQQRLWFMDQLQNGSPFYNLPIAVRLEGRLNIEALRRSLTEIMRRHESLRTTFSSTETGEPVQVIGPLAEVTLPVVDLSWLPASVRESETQELAAAEARQPFDLVHGPVLRCKLLRLDEQQHVALFTMHHIVSDAWSMGVLVKEVAALYEAYMRGAESPLEELPIQYADYAAWQRGWLQGETLERELTYWRRQLADAPPVLKLPVDTPAPAVRSLRGALETFTITPQLAHQLRKLSTTSNVTLFMTLLAAFNVLLARYSRQDDICVGTVIAGRNPEETEGLIGFFLNTLVLRTQTTEDPRFVELLARVRETCLGAYAHQDVPFEKLAEALQPERNLGDTPFFRVAFGLDNAPKSTLELPDLKLQIMGADHGAVRFDLTLWVYEDGDQLMGVWTYSTDLFEASTIKRMSGHYEKLLQGIVTNPNARLSSFRIVTEEELQQREADQKGREEASTRKLLGVKRKVVSSTTI